MTRHPAGARRGITLTEILISILIMGVGLLSLATLFPLGMVRLRAANQQHRSALLAESATADLITRGLLYTPSFQVVGYYSANGGYNPFIYDPQTPASPTASAGVTAINTGLPFCYDPLWWYLAGYTPNASISAVGELRFGQGVFLTPASNSFLRSGSNDGGTAMGHGLQRLSNFRQVAGWALFNPQTVFASPDDPVLQNADAPPQILSGPSGTGSNDNLSGLVPTNFGTTSAPAFQNDFRYTWLFTGNQVDAGNGTAFVGNVVVMDSRPFAVDQVVSPTTGTASPTAAGEIVLEAAFGFSGNVDASGHGIAADRAVLLRWPVTMPDPEIKVGSWIADVTYWRGTGVANKHTQRCHWYQVARKGDVQTATAFTNDSGAYRQMIVTTTTPVRERTLLGSGGEPPNVNVALFMPSVVNVYQRAITVRTSP